MRFLEAETVATEEKLSNYSNAGESARLVEQLTGLRTRHEKLLGEGETTSEALSEAS